MNIRFSSFSTLSGGLGKLISLSRLLFLSRASGALKKQKERPRGLCMASKWPAADTAGGDTVDHMEVASNILCQFLEVAFHHILYIRGIYEASLFERRRMYNIPVYMSAHPELNQYLKDVLTGIKPLLLKGQVEKAILSIKNKDNNPVERFVFLLQGVSAEALREDQHLVQLERDLRSVLLKISTSDATLASLPPDCTFIILVHTTESAAVSMEVQEAISEFPWVKADQHQLPQFTPDSRVMPLKTISSSILKMQLYVDGKTCSGQE